MSLTFLKEGILNTVQDLGRKGYRRFGINPNGVMDRTAARLLNVLLGSDENQAVMEMHFPAGAIRFDDDVLFALGGADLSAMLDDVPVTNWRPILAKKDSTLRFISKVSGERAYLSVRGGFELDEWLDSRSTNLTASVGGYCGRRLRKGDTIEFRKKNEQLPPIKSLALSPSLIPHYSRFPTVRLIPGAEFDLLTESSREVFRKKDFVVSVNSDRMGFRLQGEPLLLTDRLEMVSSGTSFGTIQLLPDGQLIVLMADHQTNRRLSEDRACYRTRSVAPGSAWTERQSGVSRHRHRRSRSPLARI
jgi:antagonist of KipI